MGIITLLAFGIIGWLLFLGYILPYKLITKRYHSKLAGGIVGTLCAVLIFGVFFGDHVYKYFEFRHICATQTKNEIYDPDAYEKFRSNVAAKNVKTIRSDELIPLMEKLGIKDFDPYSADFDEENQYLYYAKKRIRQDVLEQNLIDITNGKMIYMYKNYYGGTGGWLCKLMDFNLNNKCILYNCSDKGFGVF